MISAHNSVFFIIYEIIQNFTIEHPKKNAKGLSLEFEPHNVKAQLQKSNAKYMWYQNRNWIHDYSVLLSSFHDKLQ